MAPHLQLVRPVTGAPALNIWVVDQLVLQIEVAVKFAAAPAPAPRPPGSPALEEPDRFLQQARSAAKLADPHLLHVFEQGRWKGALFAVMELLEGRSLRQLLLGGPLPLPDVLAVLQQAAGVLAKAHALGLAHGSVRPDHLFLTEAAGQPFLKIANFSDISPESVPPGPATATPSPAFLRQQPYLTPEQLIQGQSSAAAADLWALGVTLYELLTTTLPFEAPTPAGVNAAICNGMFSPPSHYRADVPASLDAWFARALAKDPAARFRDPMELAREFERALSGLTVLPAPPLPQPQQRLAPPELPLPMAGAAPEFEDERTVRWELPADWAPAQPGARDASELSSAFPPEPARPSSASLSVPPPLPDRPSSYPPPPPLPGLAATPGYHPALQPQRAPRLQPLIPAQAPLPLPAPPPFAGLTKTQGLLAGSLLGGVVTLAVWGYQSWGESAEPAAPEVSAETRLAPLGTAPLETAPLKTAPLQGAPLQGVERAARAAPGEDGSRVASPRAGLRSNLANEELPVVQTDELPRAPDEPGDEEGTVLPENDVGARGVATAGPAGGSHFAPAADEARSANAKPEPAQAAGAARASGALSPAASSTAVPHRSVATGGVARGAVAPRAVAPRAVPRRETSRKTTKPANSADCNPPYFFDSNNIRRLKLECL